LWPGQLTGSYKETVGQAKPKPGSLVEVGAGSLLTDQEEPIPGMHDGGEVLAWN